MFFCDWTQPPYYTTHVNIILMHPLSLWFLECNVDAHTECFSMFIKWWRLYLVFLHPLPQLKLPLHILIAVLLTINTVAEYHDQCWTDTCECRGFTLTFLESPMRIGGPDVLILTPPRPVIRSFLKNDAELVSSWCKGCLLGIETRRHKEKNENKTFKITGLLCSNQSEVEAHVM